MYKAVTFSPSTCIGVSSSGSEVKLRDIQRHEVQCRHNGPVGGRAEDCGSVILDCLILFAYDQPCDQMLACQPGLACASNQLGSTDKTLQSMVFRRDTFDSNH